MHVALSALGVSKGAALAVGSMVVPTSTMPADTAHVLMIVAIMSRVPEAVAANAGGFKLSAEAIGKNTWQFFQDATPIMGAVSRKGEVASRTRQPL